MQAVQEHYAIQVDGLWQAATGLGAGIGRFGLVCGAVSGACLACGMLDRCSEDTANVAGFKERAYADAVRVVERFNERFGTTNCREMTGCDFRTEQGRLDFAQKKVAARVCLPAIRLAIEAVVETRR